MDFIEDVVVPLFVIFGGLVAVFAALIFFVALPMVTYECSTYQEVTGRPTKMAAGSCYVSENNNWYKWEEYKMRFATKGAE